MRFLVDIWAPLWNGIHIWQRLSSEPLGRGIFFCLRVPMGLRQSHDDRLFPRPCCGSRPYGVAYRQEKTITIVTETTKEKSNWLC